ncbi:hypothetical protein MRB53_040073 [Persea americana]|nr:hypothetical protein MRB53_040073 [Persea americana]
MDMKSSTCWFLQVSSHSVALFRENQSSPGSASDTVISLSHTEEVDFNVRKSRKARAVIFRLREPSLSKSLLASLPKISLYAILRSPIVHLTSDSRFNPICGMSSNTKCRGFAAPSAGTDSACHLSIVPLLGWSRIGHNSPISRCKAIRKFDPAPTVTHGVSLACQRFIAANGVEMSKWSFADASYYEARDRMYNIEQRMLRLLGFQTAFVVPHAICINYLQALDGFASASGSDLAKRAIQYVNTASFSPQLLVLTQQPSAIAVASIYLAAREIGHKLPDTEWWEVFDVDREDLGFLVVALQSVQAFVDEEAQTWKNKASPVTVDVVRTIMSQE